MWGKKASRNYCPFSCSFEACLLYTWISLSEQCLLVRHSYVTPPLSPGSNETLENWFTTALQLHNRTARQHDKTPHDGFVFRKGFGSLTFKVICLCHWQVSISHYRSSLSLFKLWFCNALLAAILIELSEVRDWMSWPIKVSPTSVCIYQCHVMPTQCTLPLYTHTWNKIKHCLLYITILNCHLL